MRSTVTLSLLSVLALSYSRVEAAEGKHLFLLCGQSNMKRFQHKQYFTPAVEAAYGKDNVVIVKNSEGGQPISMWHKAWVSSKGEKPAKPEKAGHLYDALIKSIRESTDGVKIQSVTFIWMQGEADVKAGHVDVYEKSFKAVVAQLEKDLGRKDINVIIGRLSDFGTKKRPNPEWEKMRQLQVAITEQNPRAVWVDTDDLNGEKDELHYVRPDGYRKLGERYVEAAKKLIKDNAN